MTRAELRARMAEAILRDHGLDGPALFSDMPTAVLWYGHVDSALTALPPGPLMPRAQLLAKLASAVGHAQEYLTEDGHEFDRVALMAVVQDPEVRDWLDEMRGLALAPEPRRGRTTKEGGEGI